MVLCAVRTDRLELFVSGGWMLLPPSIAAALSPLSFGLERRVLNHLRRELDHIGDDSDSHRCLQAEEVG